MTVTDKRSTKHSAAKKKTKSQKNTKLPPGQKLIRYVVLATLVALVPGWSLLSGRNQIKVAERKPTVSLVDPFQLGDEQKDLETQIKNLALKKPLRVGVFAIDPQTGEYVDVDGKGQYCAASIIKLPILISALKAIDSKLISPKKMLTIKAELVTGGSGHLQWQPIGTKLPFMEVARLMMIFSDNTATNMIIDALGGKDPLNKDFKTWGLTQTKLNNYLGDFAGTNKTSPYDLVYLLGRVDRGELISDESRHWMLETLKKTKVRTLLVAGLGPGAQISHKTGDIGGMVGDAGIITIPDGKKYYVAVQVERPHNDLRANALIREAAKLMYGRFANYAEMTSTKPRQPLASINRR
jgi:beta-lactamase class A